MAEPFFIICSEGGSVDRFTNLVSVFGILESITISVNKGSDGDSNGRTILSPNVKVISSFDFRVTAAWRASQDDIDEEAKYDSRITLTLPSGELLTPLERTFVFSGPLHRMIAGVVISPEKVAFTGDVIARAEIKKSADASWITQEYRFSITHEPGADP